MRSFFSSGRQLVWGGRRLSDWIMHDWHCHHQRRTDREGRRHGNRGAWHTLRRQRYLRYRMFRQSFYGSSGAGGYDEEKEVQKDKTALSPRAVSWISYKIRSLGGVTMRSRLGKNEAGYLTAEAALVLPFVMTTLVLMIFLSFYCYDRCILEQCAYAAALRGSSSRFGNLQEAQKEAMEAAESLASEKLFAVKEVKTAVRVSGVKVTVSYTCSVNMPLRGFPNGMVIEVSRSVLRNKTVDALRLL